MNTYENAIANRSVRPSKVFDNHALRKPGSFQGTLQGIYARGQDRHSRLWVPFQGHPGIPQHIAFICSLYARAYTQGQKVLRVMNDQQIVDMVERFNMALTKISVEAYSAIMEEAAKRYLHSLDMQIKDAQNDVDWQQVQGEVQEMDAKIAALEADREALETKKMELEQTKLELTNRVTEIQQQIQEQGLATDQAEQDLAKARNDLQSVEAQLDRKEFDLAEAQNEETVMQARISKKQAHIHTLDAEEERVRAEEDKIDASLTEEQVRQEQARLDMEEADLRIDEQNLRVSNEELAQIEQEVSKEKVEHDIAGTELERTRYNQQARESDIRADRVQNEVDHLQRVRMGELEQERKQTILRAGNAENDITSTDQDRRRIGIDIQNAGLDVRELLQEERRRGLRAEELQVERDRNASVDLKRVQQQAREYSLQGERENIRKEEIANDRYKLQNVDTLNAELDKRQYQSRVVEANARLAEIQADINEIALRKARVDVDKQQEQSRIAEMDVDIERNKLIEDKAIGEKETYEAEKDEIEIRKTSEIGEAETRTEQAQEEANALDGYAEREAELYDKRTEIEQAEGMLRRDELRMKRDHQQVLTDGAIREATQDKSIADERKQMQIDKKDARLDNIEQRVYSQRDYEQFVKDTLEDMEQIEVNNTVSHLIGKAT